MKPISLVAGLIFLVCACGGGPKARDASGRPVMDDTKVRHPGGEPYFCFRLVTGDGDEVSQCDVIKDWCASGINESKAAGLTILSGCKPVDAVSCFVTYSSGGMMTASRSFCWETPKDCEAMNARSIERSGVTNVSTCKDFDRKFQPAE